MGMFCVNESAHYQTSHLCFRSGINGSFAAWTMMLDELLLLLSHTEALATQTSFQRESIDITPPKIIKIHSLFSIVGVRCHPTEELAKMAALLSKLRDQVSAASATAPAPEAPNLAALEAIEALTGNKAEVDAIAAQRSPLAYPGPVRPLLDKSVDLLRQALNAKLEGFQQTFALQQAQLNTDADWKKLIDVQQADLSAQHHLSAPVAQQLGTTELLQDARDDCDLERWTYKIQALPSRFEAVRHTAVQRLKPNVVHVPLPKRTLNNEAALTV